MTAETLALWAGALLSLALGYIPGLSKKYNALDGEWKAALMGVLLIVSAIAVFALSCGAIIDVGVTCDKQGATELVTLLILALIANQSTFALAVKPFEKKP